MRQYGGFSKSSNFGNAIENVLNSAERLAQCDMLHVVFDSYKRTKGHVYKMQWAITANWGTK